MPKFDGTGPKGAGPMTGKRRGCCILKIPDTPEEPVTGFAGESGRPVRFLMDKKRPDIRIEALEDCSFLFKKDID
jgi:hypothetical protein